MEPYKIVMLVIVAALEIPAVIILTVGWIKANKEARGKTMREKLIELIRKEDKEDYLSRTQDEHYAAMADSLIASGVEIPVRCGECEHWLKDVAGCTDFVGRCEWANYMVGAVGYCVYGERKCNGTV